MTHEFKHILETAYLWNQAGKKTVLASVVALDGSSYRRPGVRMLLADSGEAVGAVSGGCVEKEVHRQAQSVFETELPKIMTYDGRYRLGCDGILYILLEPITVIKALLEAFQSTISNRHTFQCESYYVATEGIQEGMGSLLKLGGENVHLHPGTKQKQTQKLACFVQEFKPLFQLYIFGAEHDAVALCATAAQLGWEVTIVAAPDEEHSLDYFKGATRMIKPTFETLDRTLFDAQTALVLMTHSFNKDVQYLMALNGLQPAYLGLLGPQKRREEVLDKLLEFHPETDPEFIERIHGPAGINIGAESASEIAVSILAEILSVVRQQTPMALKDKSGRVHA